MSKSFGDGNSIALTTTSGRCFHFARRNVQTPFLPLSSFHLFKSLLQSNYIVDYIAKIVKCLLCIVNSNFLPTYSSIHFCRSCKPILLTHHLHTIQGALFPYKTYLTCPRYPEKYVQKIQDPFYLPVKIWEWILLYPVIPWIPRLHTTAQ